MSQMADKKKEPVDYDNWLKDRTITGSTRSRWEDQHNPKRIRIRPPTPMSLPPTPTLAPTPMPIPTPTASTPSSVVHALVTPSSMPVVAFRVPIVGTTGSLTLDYLINEVKLALCIDVPAKGDVAYAEAKIHNSIVVEDVANDDARIVAPFSHSSWGGREFLI
ncbi:hypothetical protein Ancab_012499 [Ancistrocladus abbreviatus]